MHSYTSWQYLYPPRPEHVITSDVIALYEQRGWVAQYKKNGTCAVVTISPTGDVTVHDRRAAKLKSWQCPKDLANILRARVTQKRWTMLIAELLHSKTPTIKDTLYVRDIIVYQNTHLVGTTWQERQVILDAIIPRSGAETYSHYEVDEGLWRAKTLQGNLTQLFLAIDNPKIDEGLVLFDPAGKLKWCIKEGGNASWQVKVRYPTKNYQF
jgi:hypothetical protein